MFDCREGVLANMVCFFVVMFLLTTEVGSCVEMFDCWGVITTVIDSNVVLDSWESLVTMSVSSVLVMFDCWEGVLTTVDD